MNDPIAVVAGASIECPACRTMWAWLGDHGASIELHGKCLACLLDPEANPSLTEEELDAMVAKVIELREKREAQTGRRVFPCVLHTAGNCPRCGGRGRILGYPPGVLPPS